MNRVAHLALAAVVLGSALSGCSDSSSPDEPDPTTDSSTSSAPADDGEEYLSQEDLDAAAAAVPDPSDFTYTLSTDEDPMLTYTVGTGWSDRGWASMTEFTAPGTGKRTNVMYTISTPDQQWYTLKEWTGPAKRCWAELGADQVPGGLRFMTVGTPVPYVLLDELTATDDGYTIPFGKALELFTINATTLVGWNDETDSTEPVPVDVVVEDGAVTELTVLGSDVLAVHPAPDDADAEQVEVIGQMRMEMGFLAGQSYVPVEVPAVSVIPPGEKGCEKPTPKA